MFGERKKASEEIHEILDVPSSDGSEEYATPPTNDTPPRTTRKKKSGRQLNKLFMIEGASAKKKKPSTKRLAERSPAGKEGGKRGKHSPPGINRCRLYKKKVFLIMLCICRFFSFDGRWCRSVG